MSSIPRMQRGSSVSTVIVITDATSAGKNGTMNCAARVEKNIPAMSPSQVFRPKRGCDPLRPKNVALESPSERMRMLAVAIGFE